MRPLSDFLSYNCMSERGEYISVTLTAADAIAHQRAHAAEVRPDFQYEDDEQALDDFIAIHWAWWE